MKTLPFVLAAVSMSLVAFAQTEAQPPTAHSHSDMPEPAPTEAQKAFDKLKTLNGSWQGQMSLVPPVPGMEGKGAEVAFRVASRGHTLMHDLKLAGMPDNPLTMLVVDADRLMLTHYCDADNRPRMIGKASPDGKTVEFDFLDISGNVKHGHMHHAVFTFVDESHHTEEWTFMMPGDKPMRAHFDLQRTPGGSAVSSN
jgi:hypothetical protein